MLCFLLWHKLFYFCFQIVYVARNAKDNVVSYFHFDRMEKIQPKPGDWNSFLQRFKDGKSKWIHECDMFASVFFFQEKHAVTS